MATVDDQIKVVELNEEEGRKLFDEVARYWLDMSGEDFLKAWDAGEFAGREDTTEVINVAILIPMAR